MKILRDHLRDENYFWESISRTENAIDKFEALVLKVIDERGENDQGVRNGYNVLITYYTKEVNLLYSAGAELDKIRDQYKKLLFYYSKMWNKRYGYFELIRMLSLAVLLELEAEDIEDLKNKIIAEKFDDYMVNFLLIHIDNEWKQNSDEFVFKGIYDELKSVIESRQDLIPELLEKYLEKSWYSNHKDAEWFDSHKCDQNIYYGYWSFEAGAVAKILKIDDTQLRETQYYPYDLVHYHRK